MPGIARQTEDIKKFQDAASAAYTRYNVALGDLAKVEQERPAKRKWYDEQLSILATGKDAAGPLQDNDQLGVGWKISKLLMPTCKKSWVMWRGTSKRKSG